MSNVAGCCAVLVIAVVFSLVLPLQYLSSEEIAFDSLRDFDSVSFETRGSLRIAQGDTEYLKVEASQKTLRRITAKVRGNTLYIGYRGVFTGADELPVFTLGMKDVRSIRALSAGDIQADSISAKDLTVDCGSSGGIRIGALTAETAAIRVRSSGSVAVENCSLSSLSAELSSSGVLTLSGETRILSADVSSSGSVDAGRLRAGFAEIRIRSSGGVDAWVTGQLTPRISGKGNLRCFGTPSVVGAEYTGRGKTILMGERDPQ